MVWMTGSAIQRILQGAMQILGMRHLIANVRVTIRTQKSIRPAKGSMTPVALRFEIRMRGDAGGRTVQRMFGAKRTGAERRPSEKYNRPGQSEEQREDNVNANQPSQSFHAPPPRATGSGLFIL